MAHHWKSHAITAIAVSWLLGTGIAAAQPSVPSAADGAAAEKTGAAREETADTVDARSAYAGSAHTEQSSANDVVDTAAADALVENYPDLEPLPLATLLLSDGHTDRAEVVLDSIRLDRAERDRRFEWAKYHTLRALIAQNRNDLAAAAAAFEQAIDASDAIRAQRAAGDRPRDEPETFGTVDGLVYLYLAQAYFTLEDYRSAIGVLERGGPALDGLAGAWTMRAHSHWLLGERQRALDTLAQAGERFPANSSFLRRTVFYLIEAGLYQEAAHAGMAYLDRADARADDYLAIGTALRRTKRFDCAIEFLETGHLRHPDNDDLAKALAQTWLDHGNPLAAAELLAQVAERDPSLIAETAELFRRAGHTQRALNLNARVPENDRKLKQRVAILLEMRRYDQVAGMEDALRRARVIDDEDIRYALAYSLFRGGRHEEAEVHLQALTRADLFRKSTELRKLMVDCADERWKCA